MSLTEEAIALEIFRALLNRPNKYIMDTPESAAQKACADAKLVAQMFRSAAALDWDSDSFLEYYYGFCNRREDEREAKRAAARAAADAANPPPEPAPTKSLDAIDAAVARGASRVGAYR